MPKLLAAVEWAGDHIAIIDQTRLPERLVVRRLHDVDDVVDAIRDMAVRGAPAIGICAAYGCVLALRRRRPRDADESRAVLVEAAARLAKARPTAVNLSYTVRRVTSAAVAGATPEEVDELALSEATRIESCDRESCLRIGDFGRAELSGRNRIFTHCNTGRLATAGIGTALGIVYAKADAGEAVEVLASESRPLLQGSRLTAWELKDAGIPVRLLADSAAGSALASGMADVVVVGCDRVAANGDVANKVGTYPLAVLADRSGIPFYVAGPMSSFDPSVASGADIDIEQRSASEVTRVLTDVVAPDVDVYNPAFDITPASLITGFVTDVGVLKPPFEESIARAIEGAQREGLR